MFTFRMKEIVFLNKYSANWKEFEHLLDNPARVSPDKLSELYIQLNNQLSYARTFYPESKTTLYLNTLTSKAHNIIYRNKKTEKGRIWRFWSFEYPLLAWQNRKYILYAFIILLLSGSMGALSTANDDSFARLIMGDAYVNMTLENIEKGDPMGVYKQVAGVDMFLGISLNNIRVAFYAFVMGIFLSFGTGFILFKNGVMLGSFQFFFYQHDLLRESFLTIWVHGTLEIFAIIVAGAAGLVMGHSILFPGTYSRAVSFGKGAKKGVKLVFGLIPVFLTAGFLEGFITRHTELPDIIRFGIIISSLIFIAWYFFYYPYSLTNKLKQDGKLHQL